MLTLNPKTLSPPPFLLPNPTTPKLRNPNLRCNSQHQTERGVEFETGDTFFRHESAIARDLGVLAASIYKKSNGSLRILDAMCGCGVRSLRYLVEADADFVLANDANDENRTIIENNLSRAGGGEGRWTVTCNEANRVMTECYLQRDFFDLVDVDSFGSDSSFLRSAFSCLKFGGLVYLTSTDGYSSGGHRPHHSLAAYGAYVRPLPYCNEIGLRMLIGGAVREASVLGFRVTPLFSYYSYHGPIFRVMLQVNRGKLLDERHYRFISYCNKCGNSESYSWDEIGQICCPCGEGMVSKSVVVSGPMWTGPLHCDTYVREMLDMAAQFEWVVVGDNNNRKGGGDGHLEKLLHQMLDESDPRLPFGYIKLDEIAKRGKVNSPALRTMMSALRKEGYAVSRSHIVPNAIKTDSSMANCIQVAKRIQQQFDDVSSHVPIQ